MSIRSPTPNTVSMIYRKSFVYTKSGDLSCLRNTKKYPPHNYTSLGNKNVTLVITSDSSCKDTIVKAVNVNPKPDAQYSINDISEELRVYKEWRSQLSPEHKKIPTPQLYIFR